MIKRIETAGIIKISMNIYRYDVNIISDLGALLDTTNISNLDISLILSIKEIYGLQATLFFPLQIDKLCFSKSPSAAKSERELVLLPVVRSELV